MARLYGGVPPLLSRRNRRSGHSLDDVFPVIFLLVSPFENDAGGHRVRALNIGIIRNIRCGSVVFRFVFLSSDGRFLFRDSTFPPVSSGPLFILFHVHYGRSSKVFLSPSLGTVKIHCSSPYPVPKVRIISRSALISFTHFNNAQL